ncbi:glutamate receptor ionotropic, kainate 1-like [Hyalella azteca]|uniref:Glutamate receptor ionotropic, kainate 1-like n=1 Tax=Hyalella azteca TaxID=294128 RepID=A0A8B7NS89_HYAAZ|nr:glutamate receptor ionotropic, kainate 1-like [Hyalella azteca]
MLALMDSHWPSAYVPSTAEGVRRVLEESYALLMESPAAEYYTGKNCSLRSAPSSSHMTHSFAIALPKNSPHLSEVNTALLQLQESGALGRIKNKWLRPMPPAASCPTGVGGGSARLTGVGGGSARLDIPVLSSYKLTLMSLVRRRRAWGAAAPV